MVTFFGDLSTCDSCFLLLPIAYLLEDMFFPECNAWDGFIRLICIQYGLYGHIPPNWSSSRFHIKMDNPSLVYSTAWKRPVFQSWAYWRHASKRTEFSFCRRVDNKGHFIWAGFPRSNLTTKSFVKFFLCVHMRGRAGNLGIWTLQPGNWDESLMNSGEPDGIVSHCLQYFPLHKHPI